MARVPHVCACAAVQFLYGLAFAQTTELSFFGARQEYNISGSFALGDFNGDGRPDMVTAEAGSKVVVKLNDGNGSFQTAFSVPGASGSDFAVGDFNQDGKLDVAFGFGSDIAVALGAGDGTLRNIIQFFGGTSPSDLHVAEMTGDGKLDIVVQGSGSFTVAPGRGDGTFGQYSSYSFSGMFELAIADFDRDGKVDVAGGAFAQIVYFRNLGTTFAAPVTFPFVADASVTSIAAGDLDRNGYIDIVATSSNPAYLATYKNEGSGIFRVLGSYSLKFGASEVAVADVNEDGKPDVLGNQLASSGAKPAANLFVRLGLGNFLLDAAVTYATGGADEEIVLADLRGSGRRDLLTGSFSVASVLPNLGDNTFYDGIWLDVPGRLSQSVAADFNKDGLPDLAISMRLTAPGADRDLQFSGARILLGTGKPAAPFAPGARLFVPPDVLDIETADLNKDGNFDLLLLTTDGLTTFLGSGDGRFGAERRFSATGFAFVVADFNSDGNLDVVTTGVHLLTGNGDGTFDAPQFLLRTDGRYIGAADLNVDGKPDLIMTFSTSSIGFLVALGNGDGTFKDGRLYGNSSLNDGFTVGDLNGDLLPDVITLDFSTLTVYLNTGANGVLLPRPPFGASSSSDPKTIASADLDGDGRAEVVIPDFGGADVYSLGLDLTLLNRGEFGAANYPNLIVLADFLNFGALSKTDIVTVGLNGGVSVLVNNTR